MNTKRLMFGAIALVVLGGVGAVIYFFSVYKTVSIPKTTELPQDNIPLTLPGGYHISLFADNVSGARVIAFDPKGTMMVSQPREGRIVALPDANGDGRADEQITIVSGLDNPHGLALKQDESVWKLYVGEQSALSVFTYDPETRKATGRKTLLSLPSDGGHFTRTLLFLPYPQENILLVSVGSSCNVCIEKDIERASVIAYDVTTGKSAQYAKGLRNAVFMQLHPITGAVYATEMGRDGLGDDVPPDEVNIIEKGKNYGWPICFGKNIHDTSFDKNTYIRNPCMEPFETESFIDIQAHSAPLGLAFIPEEGWHEDIWHDMVVAYHGSWNRSVPTGYKLVKFPYLGDGRYGAPEDFITGFLREDGTKIGRPVDVKIFPGGLMYISDDLAGAIYRVTKQ